MARARIRANPSDLESRTNARWAAGPLAVAARCGRDSRSSEGCASTRIADTKGYETLLCILLSESRLFETAFRGRRVATLPTNGESPEGRVSTGNPELDVILHGGLVPHRPYLLVGPSGTGKTTAALRFLCEGAKRGERVLMISLEEPPNEMRANHQSLLPELDGVYVFDAIPDVMRYERAPFKDIAAVRQSIRFGDVGPTIRKSPELASVEVTFTALEQTLRMEMARRNYTRLAIDSLTALQYFCMKGFDEIVGAQTFLRFLSDLRVTTVLTVESPLEDVETPERLLARGEIRLFRWDLDDKTVRAIGVEKFRGSPHDVRLHPYRISARGLDINLEATISRDTKKILDGSPPIALLQPPPSVTRPAEPPIRALVDLLRDELDDLVSVGVDVHFVRNDLEAAIRALDLGERGEVDRRVSAARAITTGLREQYRRSKTPLDPPAPVGSRDAAARLLSDGGESGSGQLPTQPADMSRLRSDLDRLLTRIPPLVPQPRPAVSGTEPPGPQLTPSPPTVGAIEERSIPTSPTVTRPLTVEAVPPPPPPPRTSRLRAFLGGGGGKTAPRKPTMPELSPPAPPVREAVIPSAPPDVRITPPGPTSEPAALAPTARPAQLPRAAPPPLPVVSLGPVGLDQVTPQAGEAFLPVPPRILPAQATPSGSQPTPTAPPMMPIPAFPTQNPEPALPMAREDVTPPATGEPPAALDVPKKKRKPSTTARRRFSGRAARIAATESTESGPRVPGAGQEVAQDVARDSVPSSGPMKSGKGRARRKRSQDRQASEGRTTALRGGSRANERSAVNPPTDDSDSEADPVRSPIGTGTGSPAVGG